MNAFLCIGHRGAAGHEPENTLRSIRKALELGAQGIEVDVRRALDGELVIIHDATFKRTAGAPGYVAKKTYPEIALLNAGHGEKIPRLRDVLHSIAEWRDNQGNGSQVVLNLELKSRGIAHQVTEEIIRAVESGKWRFEDIVISSFDRKELASVKDHRLRIGVLVARRPMSLKKIAERFRAKSIHIPLRIATQRFVDKAHAAGLKVYVFTVNTPDEIQRLRNLGADGVFTDFPDRVTGR